MGKTPQRKMARVSETPAVGSGARMKSVGFVRWRNHIKALSALVYSFGLMIRPPYS